MLNLLQQQVPGVRDVYFSHGGCGFYGAVVQLAQTRAGWGKQAIMAAFAAFPPLKIVTVVDDDVDIRDPSDVEWAMATRLDASAGVVVLKDVFGHGLNPSFPDYFGNKVGFDATQPFPFRPEFERATVKQVALDGLDMVMADVVQTPTRPPGAGPTLVEYILAKVGAAPAKASGPSLVEYILEKTAGGATNGGDGAGSGPAAPPTTPGNGNGALIGEKPPHKSDTEAAPTLRDWILQKTNGKPRADA